MKIRPSAPNREMEFQPEGESEYHLILDVLDAYISRLNTFHQLRRQMDEIEKECSMLYRQFPILQSKEFNTLLPPLNGKVDIKDLKTLEELSQMSFRYGFPDLPAIFTKGIQPDQTFKEPEGKIKAGPWPLTNKEKDKMKDD